MLKEKAIKAKAIIKNHEIGERALYALIAKCNKSAATFLHYRTETPFVKLGGQDKKGRDVVEVCRIPIGHRTFQFCDADIRKLEKHWTAKFRSEYSEGRFTRNLDLLGQPLTYVLDEGKLIPTENTRKRLRDLRNKTRNNRELKTLIKEIDGYPKTDKAGYDRGMGLFIQDYANKAVLEEIGSLNNVLAASCGVVLSFSEEENGRIHYHAISNISVEERNRIYEGSFVLDAVNCHFQFAVNETLKNLNLSKSSATAKKLVSLKSADDMYSIITDHISGKGDRNKLAFTLCQEYKKASEHICPSSSFETLKESGKLRKAIKTNISAMLNAKTTSDFHRRDRMIGSFLLLEYPSLYDELAKCVGNLKLQYEKYVSLEKALMEEVRSVLDRETYDEYDGLRFYGKLSDRDCRKLLAISSKFSVKLKIHGNLLNAKNIKNIVSSTSSSTPVDGSSVTSPSVTGSSIEDLSIEGSTVLSSPAPLVPYVLPEQRIAHKTRETGVHRNPEVLPEPIVSKENSSSKTNIPETNIPEPKKENQDMTKAYLEAVNPEEELEAFVKELRKEKAPVSKPLPQKAQLFLKKLEEEKQAKLLKLQQHLRHQQLHQLYEPQSTEQSTEQGDEHAIEQNEKLSNAPETRRGYPTSSKTLTSPGEAPAGSKADIKPSDIKPSERSRWLLDEEKRKKEAYETKRNNVLDIFDGVLGS